MKFKRLRFVFMILLIVLIIIIFTLYNNNSIKINIAKDNEIVATDDNIPIGQPNYEIFYENDDYSTSESISMEVGEGVEDVEQTGQSSEIEPHIDETTGIKYVTYEDFGAKSDDGYDNYQAIKNTHDYANKNNYEVRATLPVYNIYKLEDLNPISIKTNTDWNNAKFIIHDEDIDYRDTRNYAIFQISSNEKNTVITDKNVLDEIKLNTQTKKISQLAGYGECLCIAYNDKKIQYIRSGSNQNSGAIQTDVFKIDNNGNVLNYIQWNFENISKITIIPIPKETLTVKNGNFQTNLPEEQYEQSSGYFNRSISCTRSNTIIENINHTVNNGEYIGGTYFGFIRLSYVSDVTLRDSNLYSHKYKDKSNYDLVLEFSANININNVTSNDIEDTSRWGITGTNYTKDITYENCTLNRIDAHCGVYNLNIQNCTIGCKGITVVGAGNLKISNVTSLCGNGLVELRSDYGSTWNGNIIINDTSLKSTADRLIKFNVTYDNGKIHDYGYELYLPNIEINNLDLEDDNTKTEDFYVFKNDINTTGKENGDVTSIYKLPQNIIVNNYSTTSGRKIKLFSNRFYNNLSELGINFSLPLKDKEEVKITDKSGNNIGNNAITNQNIKIEIPQVEGIETTVEVNDKEIGETETQLTQDNDYKIDITYKNSNGEVENDIKNIVIDKTPPSITGVVEGGSYKYKVTPKISDQNLKEIKVLLNGQVLKNYKEGDTLEEEGNYQLTATDKAGNNAVINFSIEALTEEDYMLDDKYIKNINNNTTKTDFVKKFEFNEQYDIYRNDKILAGNEIIATGDILRTSTGTEYTLIVTGDINEDGDVNIKDIVKLRKYILSKNNLNAMEMIAADTNLDGKDINIKDLVKMRIIVLNKEIV